MDITQRDQELADKANGELGFFGDSCECPVDPFNEPEIIKSKHQKVISRACGAKEVWMINGPLLQVIYGRGHYTAQDVAKQRLQGLTSSE
jgi:hypothetical protein